MKRIVLFLFGIFICAVAIADTITVNWWSDNQTSTTTTCEIGNDVLLPAPPTKRGYTFQGWKKDSFNRGTWTDWNAVPSNTDFYPIDTHNNKIPKENDYMVISDAGLYPVDAIIVEKIAGQTNSVITIKCVINGDEMTILFRHSPGVEQNICVDKIIVKSVGNNQNFYANTDLYYNGTLLHQGDLISGAHWMYGLQFAVSLTQINGTWRFVYHGDWENDGKYGWKQEQQIVGE